MVTTKTINMIRQNVCESEKTGEVSFEPMSEISTNGGVEAIMEAFSVDNDNTGERNCCSFLTYLRTTN